MSDQLPFSIPQNSPAAFAIAYADYAGAAPQAVSAIVASATEWHRAAPTVARTGMLAMPARRGRTYSRREEHRAQRACRKYVCERAPQELGIIGWIQVALWLWRNRQLITHVIRLFREFLADRPAAFQSVLERQ